MMKGVEIVKAGGPEVLELHDVPVPQVKAGEVLIKVAAAGINRADVMQRQGGYPVPKGASLLPGLECSGTIEAVGEGVTGWEVGQEVCALLDGGGYAEKVSTLATQLLPIPKGVSLVEAAAIPEATCTVWSTVFMASELKEGEAFLMHGGTSGIGTYAIQIAKARGARVFCTAGSDKKLAECKRLGADVTINYKTDDFVAKVKEATGGKGVDVILDIMGASYLKQNLSALAPDGRLFVLGLMGGRTGEVDLGTMLMKRLTVHSAGLRGRPAEQKARIVQETQANLWPLIESGKITPLVDSTMPLGKAAEAHAHMESSVHIGKIILTP